MNLPSNREKLRARAPERYYALLASVLGLTVVSPLVDHDILGRFLIGFLAIAALVTSVLAANASRKWSIIAIGLAGCTTLIWALSLDSSFLAYSLHAQTVAYILTLGFVVTIAWLMVRDIFTNEVNGNRVAGAICVYLLFGFFFAIVHMMILLHDKSAYKDESGDQLTNSLGAVAAHKVYPVFVYYSFCTLSTVGYGDIVPVSRFARSASWLEAVAGQIYLTVLVARLVGLHIASATTATAVVAATIAGTVAAGNTGSVGNLGTAGIESATGTESIADVESIDGATPIDGAEPTAEAKVTEGTKKPEPTESGST